MSFNSFCIFLTVIPSLEDDLT